MFTKTPYRSKPNKLVSCLTDKQRPGDAAGYSAAGSSLWVYRHGPPRLLGDAGALNRDVWCKPLQTAPVMPLHPSPVSAETVMPGVTSPENSRAIIIANGHMQSLQLPQFTPANPAD